jgi:glutathione S-transferase
MRHAFGRVPVLDHDGFLLYETQAIVRYLDRILSNTSLTPADQKVAARMDQVMNVSDWYLFQGVNNVIGFHRVVAPRVLGLAPDEEAIAQAMPKAEVVFKELSRLLGHHSHFAGDDVSLADIVVGPHMDMLSETPEWAALTRGLDNLRSWLDRVRSRPSFVATTWQRVAELAKAA